MLRVDNVDNHLILHGCELGLIDDQIWTLVDHNQTHIVVEM